MSDDERLFTIAEAEALLPRLRPILTAIQEADGVLQDGERVARLREASGGNGGGESASRLLRAGRRMGRLVAELEGMGIVLRDPSTGLVDFPAQRDGRPIYLCWRLGEDGVAYWHNRDTGFMGRQAL